MAERQLPQRQWRFRQRLVNDCLKIGEAGTDDFLPAFFVVVTSGIGIEDF